MKSLNVKKLVAVGVAAAIAATPVAFAIQNFNGTALPTAKDWYLNSVVVVGHASAPSDAVWAGNIAAAIANMAYTEEQKEVSVDIEDAEVKLKVPGEIVVPGEGYTDKEVFDFDDPEWDATYTQSRVPGLIYGEEIEFDYRVSGASTYEDGDLKITEKLYFKIDAVENAPEDSDHAEMRVKTSTEGIKYTLEVSDLIGSGYELSQTSKTYEFRNLKLRIAGDEYEVKEISTDSSGNFEKVKLFRSFSKVVLAEGQSTDVDGYTIKVVSVGKSGDEGAAEIALYEGDTLVASEILKEGDTTDFDGRLSAPIKLNKVFESTAGNKAEIYKSSEELTLTDGQEEDLKGADGWKIKATEDTTNHGFKIEVYYVGDEDDTWLTFEKGAKIGEMIAIPGSARYGVVFKGFETGPTKSLHFNSDVVEFIDNDGAKHTMKLFKEVTNDSITDSDPSEFVVYDALDGKAIKFKVSISDSGTTAALDDVSLDVDIGNDGTWEITNLADSAIDQTNKKAVWDIDLTSAGVKAHMGLYVEVDIGTDGNDTDDKVTLARVWFHSNGAGTSTSEDVPYKVEADESTSSVDDGIPAGWKIYSDPDGDGSFEQIAYLNYDTSDKEIDLENDTVDVDVDGDGSNEKSLDAKADNSNWENIWVADGTYIEVEGTSKVKFTVPTTFRKLELFVGKLPETIETTGEMTAKKGDTVKIGDTEVTIEDIVAPEAKATYTEVKPIDLGRLVYLDNEVPSGKNLIVVGGYYVNSIAAAIAEEHPEIKDAVAAEGDYIVDKYTYNGKDAILVFGYTADDTAKAAQEFLNWLKQNVQ